MPSVPPKQTLSLLGFTAILLLAFVWLGVRQYDGNVSALLHMDRAFGERHAVPPGVVLYEDAGYDGMLYYQVARDLPALFAGRETSYDAPYRFQRILLPLLAYAAVLGQDRFLPYSLLAVNLLAALLSLALILPLTKGKRLHALTVVLNPAILVGVLYSLTEPLSILFIVLFFRVWLKRDPQLTALSLLLLFLSLLARETTVFLIALLGAWFFLHRQWKQMLLVTLPVFAFLPWQYYLTQRLGAVPFQASGQIMNFPLRGPVLLLRSLFTESGTMLLYRLSSIGILLYVLSLCTALGRVWIDRRGRVGLFPFLVSGLAFIMLSMDATTIWGSITSIGRVVAPIYPVYALYASKRDTKAERLVSWILIAVSIVAAVGIASVPHPFTVS